MTNAVQTVQEYADTVSALVILNMPIEQKEALIKADRKDLEARMLAEKKMLNTHYTTMAFFPSSP